MHAIKVSQMKDIVSHVVLRLNEPVFFWGQPGVGKTEGVTQAGREADAFVSDLRLGTYETVDFRGVCDIDHENNQTTWFPAKTLPIVGNKAFPTDRPILMVYDEANHANPSVSGIMYQVINEGRCGEYQIMPNVRSILMGNREGDRGVTQKQPKPLSNRLTHYEIVVDHKEVIAYGASKGWPDIALAFLGFRGEALISTFDPNSPDKAFATPRTWEKALAKTYADPLMPDWMKRATMAGQVGEGPANEFWGFVDSWATIQKLMPSIRKDPVKAKVPEEASLLYAVTVCVSGELSLKTSEHWNKYLMRLDPEFSAMAWQLAVKRDPELFRAPEFLEFCRVYRDVFQ